MAVGEGSSEPDDDDTLQGEHGRATSRTAESKTEDELEEDEDEEEEPRLKYATLTKSLSSLYRNGDASSAVLVAGDKMIVGTHNGNIHVVSLPHFQSLRVYHAHSASISAVSISPFPPPPHTGRLDAAQRLTLEAQLEESKRLGPGSPGAKNSPKQPVPATPSNQIYIATSSIDGNVCISSLVDEKDVQLRNFGRPIQTVALSPEYKHDRNYLSGGQAGTLILTTGGQSGRSANATTTGTAAAASGWLGSIGLGANTGTDKVLHSGEGIISVIKWSRSGKYVLWVNEEGIKVMRSNLKLESADIGSEWRRISHVDRPSRDGWEEMAGVWKARVEWIDRENLEVEEEPSVEQVVSTAANGSGPEAQKQRKEKTEEVVVGWGDNVWILKVYPGATGVGKNAAERRPGSAEIITNIRFNDCTISGTSLYTPNLLLILAHMEQKRNANGKKSDSGQKKGRHNRSNALEPELRLIDVNTKEEIDTDTLTVSRFETLSASDYHLGILPPSRIPVALAQRGYLGTIGSGVGNIGSGLYSGVETVGQGVWDATAYSGRMLGANRIFSGADSVKSGKASGEKTGSVRGTNYLTGWIPGFGSAGTQSEELNTVASTQGMKIFIYSPYDCIVAVKRNLADRLQWLVKMERYEEAWDLIDQHPEAAGTVQQDPQESISPPTPSKSSSLAQSAVASPTPAHARQQATLAEFFADSASMSSTSKIKDKDSAAEKEKRRIGELWLQQLVSANKWDTAGEVAGKVLNTSTRWEYWIWHFIRTKKFDEISPVVPTFQITPPLPSTIFEIILGHYVLTSRLRFKELLDLWPSDLFEISSISNAVEDQLQSEVIQKDSTDWRILQECLAKLYLADGHYKEALRCYIRLQDADTAMAMIKEQRLVEAIADDVPALVLLRISSDQLKRASQEELAELSSEPIKLLVDEASHGVVEPDEVVSQLQAASLMLFVYLYLRALWRGEGLSPKPIPRIGLRGTTTSLAADEGKTLVERFADTAIELFAEYDRDLLMEFLVASTSYEFEKAVHVCERKHYIEELVYLLSKTGEMKKALFLIIDELKDVSKAISFAKEQNDKDLWNDLLDYSMSRPRFISSLLIEVGTAIDPITLVKRIPSGLEIEGLRDGLQKMIREYDLQNSISSGAARVMSSEVAVGMMELRNGRRKGIKFDVAHGAKRVTSRDDETTTGDDGKEVQRPTTYKHSIEPGHCAACGKAFFADEKETVIGFACGHVFHVTHLLQDPSSASEPPTPPPEFDGDVSEPPSTFTRSIKTKVTNARLLRDQVAAIGGCRICKGRKVADEQV